MTAPHKPTDYNRQHPKDERAYEPRNKDVYQSRGKYPEPSVCSGCGAIYTKGGWRWGQADANAHVHMCPACQRIHDKIPAGIITLSGEFVMQNQKELQHMMHNLEGKEKSEHPLQRIMSMQINENSITVSLTDFHLTEAIVKALEKSYQGEAKMNFVEHNNALRATWVR